MFGPHTVIKSSGRPQHGSGSETLAGLSRDQLTRQEVDLRFRKALRKALAGVPPLPRDVDPVDYWYEFAELGGG